MNEVLLSKIQFKIAQDDLLKKCRRRDKVAKRMFIYNLMYNHDVQVTHIGRFFNRNHASIIHGIKTYSGLIQSKDKYLISVLKEYMDFFNQYDIKRITYSIRKDLQNATTMRDIGIMRKRLENNMYHDLNEKRNGRK